MRLKTQLDPLVCALSSLLATMLLYWLFLFLEIVNNQLALFMYLLTFTFYLKGRQAGRVLPATGVHSRDTHNSWG